MEGVSTMTISDGLQAWTTSDRAFAALRRTKIVATLGPSTDGRLDELIAAGMDCARLNCSHGTREDLIRRTSEVRAAAAAAGRSVAVMFDLQGPKIRLVADIAVRTLNTGEQVLLSDPGNAGHDALALAVAYEGFCDLLSERSEVVIGDGAPRLRVVSVDGSSATAVVTVPGAVRARKGVNVTHARTMAPALTSKDHADARVAVECDADFVALSFVRSADDVLQLRELLNAMGGEARIVAKIEKVEAFEHLDPILDVADGLMVARGDYGVEAGIAHVPEMQKETIHKASSQGKLVITATQMLESMINAPLPTRAEAADVFNAIMDGTSALMLSAETGAGSYPVDAVRTMAEIAEIAERQEIYCGPHATPPRPDEAVMHAAVALARDVDAAAIVVPTTTGRTARECARYRPHRPIHALCDDERVCRQLALEWGVFPTIFEHSPSTDELLQGALRVAAELDGLHSGDAVVITAGQIVGTSGATNLITLRFVP
jgi:pyruvate kinase